MMQRMIHSNAISDARRRASTSASVSVDAVIFGTGFSGRQEKASFTGATRGCEADDVTHGYMFPFTIVRQLKEVLSLDLTPRGRSCFKVSYPLHPPRRGIANHPTTRTAGARVAY